MGKELKRGDERGVRSGVCKGVHLCDSRVDVTKLRSEGEEEEEEEIEAKVRIKNRWELSNEICIARLSDARLKITFCEY